LLLLLFLPLMTFHAIMTIITGGAGIFQSTEVIEFLFSSTIQQVGDIAAFSLTIL